MNLTNVNFHLLLSLSVLLAGGRISLGAEPGPLAAALQPLVENQIITGMVVAVADSNKSLDEESVGLSSLESRAPMRNDALFWIASMTKPITATALMMLADEGKLSVSDPVEKYLPEFKGQMVAGEDDKGSPHPPRHPITISDVLSHTSGLVLPNDPALHPSVTLQEEVAQFGARPLLREPGAKYQYNNTGINTAGRIIEVVGGMPYAEFLKTRLLDPLEMTETTFWPSEAQAQRLARSARRATEGKLLVENRFDRDAKPELIARLSHGLTVPQPLLSDFGLGKISDYVNHYAMPAGGLYSTAADVAKFGQMLLNGGVVRGKRLLSEAAIREMTTSRTDGLQVSPSEAYGLGWSLKTRADEGLPAGSFGHRGARRTALWIDPADKLVLVVMVARMDMTGDEQKQMYGGFCEAAVAKYGAERR